MMNIEDTINKVPENNVQENKIESEKDVLVSTNEEVINLLKDLKQQQISIRKEVQRTRRAIIQEIVPITNKLRDVLLLGLALVAIGGAFYSLSKEKQNEYAEKFLTTTLTGGGIIAVGVKLYQDSKERSSVETRSIRRSQQDEETNEEDIK